MNFLRLLFSDFEIVDGMNSPHHERLEAIKDENERIKGTTFWKTSDLGPEDQAFTIFYVKYL